MKTLTLLMSLLLLTLTPLAGCATDPITGERTVDIDRLQRGTQILGQVAVLTTLATGEAIVRSENAKRTGNALCNALAAPDSADTILAMLANNGLCDVFLAASTSPAGLVVPTE